jgi:catechol 2,3-dioxygenase-like lactoylglutathione lyase family enzyme
MPFGTVCTRVVMLCHRYDACHDFYRRVLGFPVFTDHPERAPTRNACFGTEEWGVEIIEWPTAPPDNGRMYTAIEVSDVDAVREDVARRLQPLPEVRDEGWARALTLAAPDGYRLEFFTRRPKG